MIISKVYYKNLYNINNMKEIKYNNLINSSYYIEYNLYQKKLMNKIFSQLDIIFNLFNEEFNDNLIKLYIMMKKNKFKEKISKKLSLIFKLISFLKKLKYIDQLEFIYVIFYLIKLYILIPQINLDEYSNFVNFNLIKNNIISVISIILKENYLFQNLLKLNFEVERKKNIKKILYSISENIINDFFMYFTSDEIFILLNKNLNIKNISNHLSKYKKYILNKYQEKFIKYNDIYSEIDNNYKCKFKYIIRNKYFFNFINELIIIKKNYNFKILV